MHAAPYGIILLWRKAESHVAERKLIAKAFQSIYGPKEPVLNDVTAKKVSESTFIISLPNGIRSEVSLGEQINELPTSKSGDYLSGTLEQSASGILSLGGKSILIGEHINPLAHAIKIRSSGGGDQYLIREGAGDKSSSSKVHIGQQFKDYGSVSIDQYGNLSFSGRDLSIPIYEKRMERNLVVFDQPGKGGQGKEAYLNIVIPGEEGGEQIGQSGIFFERWGNRPAKFGITPKNIHLDEYSLGNDKLKSYVVAVFFPSRSPGYTSCSFRTADDALSERYVFLKMKEEKERVKKESSLIGISPSDHPDTKYVKHLEEKLAYYNKGCYQHEGWRITEGWSLFGAKEPSARRDNDHGMRR